MINEAPTTSARSALTSIKLDRIVQTDCEVPVNSQLSTLNARLSSPRIALLTGGGDKPYALGIAAALTSVGISVDFIGSDDLQVPELLANPRIHFLNLRRDQRSEAGLVTKVLRILNYYVRLVRYVAKAEPKVFHILWNNKFEFFDRTLLMIYYRLMRKRLVFTAHNVNASKRDSNDSWRNRLSLRAQYAFLFIPVE
jgi:hypothetical protein